MQPKAWISQTSVHSCGMLSLHKVTLSPLLDVTDITLRRHCLHKANCIGLWPHLTQDAVPALMEVMLPASLPLERLCLHPALNHALFWGKLPSPKPSHVPYDGKGETTYVTCPLILATFLCCPDRLGWEGQTLSSYVACSSQCQQNLGNKATCIMPSRMHPPPNNDI